VVGLDPAYVASHRWSQAVQLVEFTEEERNARSKAEFDAYAKLLEIYVGGLAQVIARKRMF
jgi:hypothetical protein